MPIADGINKPIIWPETREITLDYPDGPDVMPRVIRSVRGRPRRRSEWRDVTGAPPALAGFEDAGRRLWDEKCVCVGRAWKVERARDRSTSKMSRKNIALPTPGFQPSAAHFELMNHGTAGKEFVCVVLSHEVCGHLFSQPLRTSITGRGDPVPTLQGIWLEATWHVAPPLISLAGTDHVCMPNFSGLEKFNSPTSSLKGKLSIEGCSDAALPLLSATHACISYSIPFH